MKAAVLRGADQPFVIEDITLGALLPSEILVKIVGVGVCHTDLLPRLSVGEGIFFGDSMVPVVLGHEGSGIVAEVGSAVTQVKPGDHVLLSYDACGFCDRCLSGAPAYCVEFQERNMHGKNVDLSVSATDADGVPVANRFFAQSSFAEFAITTERNTVKVDPSLPLELLGPLGCGLQTGAGSVLNEMKLRAGQSIVVFGAGAVGLAAVMAAKAANASEIVVVDIKQSRLDLALELGATRVVIGTLPPEELVAAIIDGGKGLDFAFDTTAVGSVMTAAISSLAFGGKAVLIGAGLDFLNVFPTLLTGRTVTFAYEGSSVPQIFIPQLIDLWQRGLFPLEKLTRTYSLDEINQAEADTKSGVTVKPILLPTPFN